MNYKLILPLGALTLAALFYLTNEPAVHNPANTEIAEVEVTANPLVGVDDKQIDNKPSTKPSPPSPQSQESTQITHNSTGDINDEAIQQSQTDIVETNRAKPSARPEDVDKLRYDPALCNCLPQEYMSNPLNYGVVKWVLK